MDRSITTLRGDIVEDKGGVIEDVIEDRGDVIEDRGDVIEDRRMISCRLCCMDRSITTL
jgi:hypothetical protein